MPEPLSDADLLALIEGEVPADRAAALRDALRADPALRARLERLAADRDHLARLPDHLPAPSRTVELAMARAANHTHTQDPAAARRRRFAMVAAAGLGIAILAGVFGLIINATHPALRARREATRAQAAPVEMRAVGAEDAQTPVIGPLADAQDDADPDGIVATTTAQDIAAELDALAQADASDAILDEFLSSIDHRAATDAPTGLSDAQLAALVREGRLEVVITTRGPRGTTVAGAPDTARPAAPIADTVSVDIPADATDAEVRAAIEEAIRVWRAESGLKVEWRASKAASAPASPSTEPKAVIWWNQVPRDWRARNTLTIPVRMVDPAATPGAPPPPASN